MRRMKRRSSRSESSRSSTSTDLVASEVLTSINEARNYFEMFEIFPAEAVLDFDHFERQLSQSYAAKCAALSGLTNVEEETLVSAQKVRFLYILDNFLF